MPSEFTDIKDSVIGGRLEIKDNAVKAINVVFKIQNASPIIMKNQELFIDNNQFYSITFDKYNFSQDNLINQEMDFVLMQNNKKFHRLFFNNNNPCSNVIASAVVKAVYSPNE